LKDNLDKLHMMAESLVELETLTSDQIDDIMAGAKPRSNNDDDISSDKDNKKGEEPPIKDPAEQV
jgi:cell division protease FtsH